MKTNKQKKIQTPVSGFKRSRFNWAHDVNTTFSWGEIQPTQCKFIVPNSKTTLSTQELIRMAPMVEPTFGRVKFKTFNQFVNISDVFENYDAMMAQEPVSTSFGTKVPQALPSILLGRLCSYVLHGARATIYFSEGNDNATRLANADAGKYITLHRSSVSASAPSHAAITALNGSGVLSPQANAYVNLDSTLNTGYRIVFIPSLTDACAMKRCYTKILGTDAQYDNPNKVSVIPFCNPSFASLFPVKSGVVAPDNMVQVSPLGADYVFDFSVTDNSNNTYYYALCVELSDYGKRIRKVLQGCGYQIDFSANYDVSLIPLFAQYKAYFDVFGLQLYQGWETTSCAKVIDSISQTFTTSISRQDPNDSPYIQDLPNLFNDLAYNHFQARYKPR